ncbi:uncharacterized protein LOC114866289 isoform X2 [Betta splendens]|uniref:Uncharacterized protein LOC114866289 isoform X2 n=1 Tax=Betta splendens TaxID=158456 RepID=A0A6P7P0X5_BETSP|nr:uncharacterized protein LOC114866289 isoform X2 [Betta splendens]
MISENHRRQRHAAFVPFPRSTWIHPHVPCDDFDRVCKVIWARAKKCEARLGRGYGAAGNKRTHRADEQQRHTNDWSENAQCEEGVQQRYCTEFTLPCPQGSGRGRPCVARSARATSPAMEEKMKLSKEETEGKGDLDKGEQQNGKIWVHESRSQSINHYDPSGERYQSVDEHNQSDFPPLSTAGRGLLPHPTGPPASGKLHGQWEIPLPIRPHNPPADTLASAPASVQGGAEAPRAASKTFAPPAARTQRGPYDLLADFPALQPPTRPLALGERHGGNPKSRDAVGEREIIQRPNDGQEAKAVAGADGAGVNARSWACAAKAGMKQAAAPQERARPCSFQQLVTINRAKAVNQSATNKGAPSFIGCQAPARGVGPLEAGSCRDPNRFVRLVYPPSQQCFSRRRRLLPVSLSLSHRKTNEEELKPF